MTESQAAQQANRDGAGRYSTKTHAESGVDLAGAPSHVRDDAIRARAELDRIAAELAEASSQVNELRHLPASPHRTERIAESAATASDRVFKLTSMLRDSRSAAHLRLVADGFGFSSRIQSELGYRSGREFVDHLAKNADEALGLAHRLVSANRERIARETAGASAAFYDADQDHDEPDHSGCTQGQWHECTCFVSAPCSACVSCPGDS